MYKYMLEHEQYIMNIINSSEEQDWDRVKAYHKAQIEFMQHERLVHLMVTIAFAFILLASYVATFLYPRKPMILLVLILTILELFYIVHYYRLENGVQRWYKIYNDICKRIGTAA